MATRTDAEALPHGQIDFDRPDNSTLLIRLSGPWVLKGTRPAATEVEQELAKRPARRIAFDTSDLEHWDTAVLTFLNQVLSLSGTRGLDVDRSGLPHGVGRLMGLADAVPERSGARSTEKPAPLLERLGKLAIAAGNDAVESLRFLGEVTIALGRALRFQARFQTSDLFYIIQQAGAAALPIVTLISFLLGLILAFMGAVQLTRFGATIYVADLVGLAMAREMGAVMTAIVMAGRTGAAFAAQLGTMKVTEEIDALTTFGISPIEFLVLPRMIALCLMMPLLCLYADLMGILGGMVVAATMLDITLTQYVNETIAAVSLTNFLLGIFKSAVFGILIAIAGCLRGMQSGDNASAVGDAATRAVVTSIVLIIVTDGLFAVVCNILGI